MYASGLTLLSLALMVWAVLHPAPLAVMAAMSIGQGIGTLGALCFFLLVLRDLRSLWKYRAMARAGARAKSDSLVPPSQPGSQPPSAG